MSGTVPAWLLPVATFVTALMCGIAARRGWFD